MRDDDTDVAVQNAPRHPGTERRWDWLMRQFVDQMLSRNSAKAEVRRALLERGVPHHVADRVLPPRR